MGCLTSAGLSHCAGSVTGCGSKQKGSVLVYFNIHKTATMEIEYSNEVKGKVHAYRFTTWEMLTIAQALRPIIRNLYKKIERIENNPRNEGQCTYSEQIRLIRMDIRELEEIVRTFDR